jgi:prevent-host-death family protein
MAVVNMHEAKTNLSQLVKRAAAGEEIIVAKAGEPVAMIVAYTPSKEPRTPGALKGQIKILPGFDEIPDEFEDYLP